MAKRQTTEELMRAWRARHGLTYREAARRADVSLPTWWDLENGKAAMTPKTAQRLGRAMRRRWWLLIEGHEATGLSRD